MGAEIAPFISPAALRFRDDKTRSARGAPWDFPREMTENILQTRVFHPGRRCAFVSPIAQRATYAL